MFDVYGETGTSKEILSRAIHSCLSLPFVREWQKLAYKSGPHLSIAVKSRKLPFLVWRWRAPELVAQEP